MSETAIDDDSVFRRCHVCNAALPTTGQGFWQRRWCSPQCRKVLDGACDRRRKRPVRLATSTTGAAHELLVCADLLKRGYEVFRSMSPSASVDIIVHRDGRLLRVEVKTSERSGAAGRLHVHTPRPECFDVLAIVEWSGRITYVPEIEKA